MDINPQLLFSALSNDIRLRCMTLMQLQGELCVCELMHALKLSQPMISRHLALLREDNLVDKRRAGQWMYYRINADLADWVQVILKTMALENCNHPPFADDLIALTDMPNRPGASCCA